MQQFAQDFAAVAEDNGKSKEEAELMAQQVSGVSFLTILQLLITFGPQLFSIIQQILDAFKSPAGFVWSEFESYAKQAKDKGPKYGKAFMDLVNSLAKKSGATVPQPPASIVTG